MGDQFLEQLKLKNPLLKDVESYEELDTDERKAYDDLYSQYQQANITPEKFKEFVESQYHTLSIAVAEHHVIPNDLGTYVKDENLKARLRNMQIFLDYLNSPDSFRKQMEKQFKK